MCSFESLSLVICYTAIEDEHTFPPPFFSSFFLFLNIPWIVFAVIPDGAETNPRTEFLCVFWRANAGGM